MSEVNQHITRINTKLQQLLKQYDALVKENAKGKEQMDAILKERALREAQMEDLQQQNLILKASLQSLEPGEKRELEQKLTQYIKNIDKSISLLSQ